MYARMINILFRPDALDDVTRHFREVSVPLISSHTGCIGIFAAINRETGRIYLITLWDSAETRDASSVNPEFIQNMASFAEWMAGGFNREPLDIVANTLPDYDSGDPNAPAIGRFTFVTVDPEQWDESVRAFSPLSDSTVFTEHGFQGGLLLANQSAGRLILIDLWETRDQIVNTDVTIFDIAQPLRQTGAITAVPTHDVVEVVSRVMLD
jgi:quinol monooxygenase YgiN